MSFIVCVRAVISYFSFNLVSWQKYMDFFFFTIFKQIIVYYCNSTKHSKGYNASHSSRGAEINWKSSKTRIRKKCVTDRNGYKLHQTFVCFIEPSIPLKWKLVCSDTHSPTKRCRSCTYHKLTFYGHDSNSSRTITDLECGKYRK